MEGWQLTGILAASTGLPFNVSDGSDQSNSLNMAVDPSSSEEQRLVAEYHVATERYTAAVGELAQHRAALTKSDYQKLLNLVEDARNECERVRNSLARLHEKE